MNSAFKISLGIAAIDCLLSAFVAILVTTLSIIGSGEQGSALDLGKSVVLSLNKTDTLSGHMKIKLLIVIYSKGREPTVIVPKLSNGGLSAVPALSYLSSGGSAFWLDCSSTSDHSCTSQLLVTRPNKICWSVGIFASTTERAYSDVLPPSITIQPMLIQSTPTISSKAFELPLGGEELLVRVDVSGERPIMTVGERCPG